jgi:hypothetical protein
MSAESAAPRPGLLDDYLSEAELAEELQKDVRTLQRWRKLGVGPPFTLTGVTPKYPRSGAARWLRAAALPALSVSRLPAAGSAIPAARGHMTDVPEKQEPRRLRRRGPKNFA